MCYRLEHERGLTIKTVAGTLAGLLNVMISFFAHYVAHVEIPLKSRALAARGESACLAAQSLRRINVCFAPSPSLKQRFESLKSPMESGGADKHRE